MRRVIGKASQRDATNVGAILQAFCSPKRHKSFRIIYSDPASFSKQGYKSLVRPKPRVYGLYTMVQKSICFQIDELLWH